MTTRSRLIAAALCLSTAALAGAASAQGRTTLSVTRATPDALRVWNGTIDTMLRDGRLVVRGTTADTAVPGRTHQRIDQYYRGIRIEGGDLTRQMASDGVVSIFGTLHTAVAVDPTPALSPAQAATAIAAAVGGTPPTNPELVILPLSDGDRLAYAALTRNAASQPMHVYVDANTGTLLAQYSDVHAEVGIGTGTFGDVKKMDTLQINGTFFAEDTLRPAPITTYDMKGNLVRTIQLTNLAQTPVTTDIASSPTDTWTDGTVVDAQVSAGRYEDYLYKRFGRQGLDNRNLRMALFTHPVSLATIAAASPDELYTYFINAEYCPSCGPNGEGSVVFGEGAPLGFAAPGVTVMPFSAALDVVAHELTHGVTAATAALGGPVPSEADALNEGFSDVFGVSTAFFYEPPGNGPLQASYVMGHDVTVPSGAYLSNLGTFIARDFSNPANTNGPDHYAHRATGLDDHYDAMILDHAFYLAVEGGTNRTSGLTVQGVGAANRDEIEKAFFRALTLLLPSSANFGVARTATIQAATDLYGIDSAAVQAITEAWDAVGVQPRTVPTAAITTPVVGSTTATCATYPAPIWDVAITISSGTEGLSIAGGEFDYTDADGRPDGSGTISASDFASAFGLCAADSNHLQPNSDACAYFCFSLDGATSGGVQFSITGTDDTGAPVALSTPRAVLLPPQ